MAAPTQLISVSQHGGMNAESSKGSFPSNEYELLQNIELSDNSTLKKRKGFQQEGDKQSTSEIKFLDRYINGDTKHLLKSEDSKLFYQDKTPGITSPVRLRETLSSATNFDSDAGTIELTLSGIHPFLEDDNIFVTISATDYIWLVTEVLSTTSIRVLGVISDISGEIAGTETVYAGRVSDEVVIEDGSSFAVNDMVYIGSYTRPFKILDIDTNTLTIDEEIYYADASTDCDVTIQSRWEQFLVSDSNIQNDTPFDSNGGLDKVSSSMLKNLLCMTNGSDEPLAYDGSKVFRLGFYELPDMPMSDDNSDPDSDLWYNLYVEDSGNLDAGIYKYKLTFSMYDSNGNRYTSGTSSIRTIKLDDFGNVLIPVFTIPYNVNNNLMYDVDSCVVTTWRTEAAGTTSYYRSVEVPMNQLGTFLIASIEEDGIAITGDTHTNTTVDDISDISKCKVGQVISGADFAAGTYITDVDTGTSTITISEAASGSTNDLATTIERLKLTLDGTPDLSNIKVGDYLLVKGCKDAVNNGVGIIDEVDDVNKILYVSLAGTDDATGTSIRAFCSICIRDNVNDYELIRNELLYTNDNIEAINDMPPIAKFVTSWDNKMWSGYGYGYQDIYLNLDLTIVSESPFENGDLFYISDGTDTEIYEFVTDGTDATDGHIRVDCQNVNDLYTQIKVLCETINANQEGFCWALYENATDSGGILLRERQRNSNVLKVKFDLNTTNTLVSVKIDNTWLTASDNDIYFNFSQDEYSSRIWWTKDGDPGAYVGTFLSGGSDEVQYRDIADSNGQKITGMIPLSSMLIVFKESSIYRVVKTSQGYEVEDVDSEVGCDAPKSVCSVGNKVLFLNKKGVYATDGYSVKFVGKKMQQYWSKINRDYISEACGSHNINRHQYIICFPDKTSNPEQSTNNNSLVYDYLNDAWFNFTNVEASMFTKIDMDLYYSTYTGLVYKARSNNHKSDYRDDASAIESIIVTAWFDFGIKPSRKMVTHLTVNIYLSDTSNRNMRSYFAVDMQDSFYDLETIHALTSPWGHFPWGHSPWGKLLLQPSRQSVAPQKCLYGRFKFINDTIDEALEIQEFFVEGKILSPAGINQPINS